MSGSVTGGVAASSLPRLAGVESYREQVRLELGWGRLVRFGVILAEFALLVAAVRLLNIESRSFELVLTLALAGFVVHHFLPAAWRPAFFAGLSVASVLLVFGWEQGGWLLAMGCVLIALCHLPVGFAVRIGLIVLVAGVMAAERRQLLPGGGAVPSAIWPILGAMFMFRLIVYLYDLKHGAAPFGPARALGYFFMLPNVCFPLFPVVDYKTLQRSAYNDDALRLYQTGVKWMLRGLLQLLLYKIVYFLLVIDPSEAVNGTGAARYMIATYLLYLKISGLFHLIVGILHMYGYGLAETHHMYLFASSFTDFWRRINIYWKDFIQKLVFNPIYFLARRLGGTGALVASTLVAFVATWAFHSYQWFWIRGSFPIVWSDLVFWFGLGLVVLANVLLETRRGRRRSLSRPVRSWREDVVLGLKIAGTFASICVLWTIWSTPEPAELGFVWRAVLNSGPRDLAVLIGVPLLIGALGVLFGGRRREAFGAGAAPAEPPAAFWRQAAGTALATAVLIAIALRPALLQPASPKLATLMRDINYGSLLNTADARRLQRGYYEDLGDVTRFNSELWAVYGREPPGWAKNVQERSRDDAMRLEYIASTTGNFKGATFSINSAGMRDREYSVVPPPDTLRVALVGSSNDMGAGVNDGETYENLVEDRLNREVAPRSGLTYQILNFSHGGYTPTQKLAITKERVLEYKPDIVLYVAHSRELDWMLDYSQLRHLTANQLLDDFPYVEHALDLAGVQVEHGKLVPDSEVTLRPKLAPFAADAFQALLQQFRDVSTSVGAKPALMLLELPNDTPLLKSGLDRLAEMGQAAGLPVLDLRGAFADVADRNSLWIAPWDDHTNAAGHRLLADRFYAKLLDHGLVPTGAAATGSGG
jgi:alginate O-acetyltransferase complex protein AlgI